MWSATSSLKNIQRMILRDIYTHASKTQFPAFHVVLWQTMSKNWTEVHATHAAWLLIFSSFNQSYHCFLVLLFKLFSCHHHYSTPQQVNSTWISWVREMKDHSEKPEWTPVTTANLKAWRIPEETSHYRDLIGKLCFEQQMDTCWTYQQSCIWLIITGWS